MGILKSTWVAAVLSTAVLVSASVATATQASIDNTTSVCISCHIELGGEMAEPVTLWEKSIHRQMGNNCEGCHGGDPGNMDEAMNPERGFVGSPNRDEIAPFCGKCHVGVKENYMQSPHYLTSLEGEGPTCITCHHSHDVQKASFNLVNEELCSQCHSFENAQNIKKVFVSAEIALTEKKEELRYLGRRGMPVKRLEEKLFALRNSLHQMTHTLNFGEIQEKTRGVLEDLDVMNVETKAFQKKIHRRWWIGAGVAGFLVILIFALIQLLKTYEEEE